MQPHYLTKMQNILRMSAHFAGNCLFHASRLAMLLALSLVFTACDERKPEQKEEVIRHIKSMKLEARADQQSRLIAGVVTPVVSSNVAFEIGGQVTKMTVSVGDRVKSGDLIAELDPQTYELRLQSAEGALQAAQAKLSDAEKKFEQQKQLFTKKFTTKTNYDSALSTLEAARSDVSIQKSQVSIARRNLTKTKLLAPFSGAISEKHVEVFEEVTAGKPIVTLHTEGNYEIDVSLPETLVNEVKVGDEVDVQVSIGQRAQLKGYIKDISSQASQGNAYPVTIGLVQDETAALKKLRPGMSVEVTFKFAQAYKGTAFFVPTAAILPTEVEGQVHLFVYNAEAGMVEKRSAQVVNIRDNNVMIAGDVKAGDIIAVAGVSFLVDKMKVNLLERSDVREN
ncbi:MAG: hemolysin secretion protein D [Rhodomicrobium sp.]|nr:MAG: hemolysin secretion protein D [Rhodomicrobium sp.]